MINYVIISFETGHSHLYNFFSSTFSNFHSCEHSRMHCLSWIKQLWNNHLNQKAFYWPRDIKLIPPQNNVLIAEQNRAVSKRRVKDISTEQTWFSFSLFIYLKGREKTIIFHGICLYFNHIIFAWNIKNKQCCFTVSLANCMFHIKSIIL